MATQRQRQGHRAVETGRLLAASDHVCFDTLELDRDDTSWLLTHYMKDLRLRLRIRHDETSEFDSKEEITFEVKLWEADAFVALGDTVVVAYRFTSEWQEVMGRMPCVCGIPTPFRPIFVQMLGRWGELRTMCMFRPTVTGRPFQRSRRGESDD